MIKQTGVTTKKQAPDILMAIAHLSRPTDRYDQLYLSNYAMIQIQPELARLPGVSDVMMFGQRDYSMRIWLDPDKLAVRNLTAGDVVAAIREQNLQVATGQIGQQPMTARPADPGHHEHAGAPGRRRASSRTSSSRPRPTGAIVRIKDVGRVELGPRTRTSSSEVDGKPSGNLAIFQLPDANALESADMVMAKIDELKKDFPDGPGLRRSATTRRRSSASRSTRFSRRLRDAVILVALVVLLFLQNWRSAIIPLIAVPVAIIGTFAVMLAMGFTSTT